MLSLSLVCLPFTFCLKGKACLLISIAGTNLVTGKPEFWGQVNFNTVKCLSFSLPHTNMQPRLSWKYSTDVKIYFWPVFNISFISSVCSPSDATSCHRPQLWCPLSLTQNFLPFKLVAGIINSSLQLHEHYSSNCSSCQSSFLAASLSPAFSHQIFTAWLHRAV